eukprot:442507-Pleurochrysis_carterae.AAC.1
MRPAADDQMKNNGVKSMPSSPPASPQRRLTIAAILIGDKDNDVNSNAESGAEADKGNIERDTPAWNVENRASHSGAKGSDVRNKEGYEKMPVGWDGG